MCLIKSHLQDGRGSLDQFLQEPLGLLGGKTVIGAELWVFVVVELHAGAKVGFSILIEAVKVFQIIIGYVEFRKNARLGYFNKSGWSN